MMLRSAICAIAILLIGGGGDTRAQAVAVPEADRLLSELGCAHCHADLKAANTLRERTPDLSTAGLRYNLAYLFDYLQNPVRVRHHLGLSRMPDFRLSAKEALALVAFLQTQRRVSGLDLPTEIQNVLRPAKAGTPNASKEEFQRELTSGLICLTCHRFDGKGGSQGVELSEISFRLQRDWMKAYLVAPSRFGVPPTTMPPQFYQIAADGVRFQELTPQAARKIDVLAGYLFSLNGEKRKALDEKFNAAKSKFPEVTAEMGESVFKALNCSACHRHSSIGPRSTAPPLAQEGRRVNAAWLENYLRHPVAIRPFGFHPGEGSRMPDFKLSAEEAGILGTFLRTNAPLSDRQWDERERTFEPRKLSAFAKRKAELLLTERLSCLGCHRFGEKGGRIAPDLAAVRGRLQPDYVFQMIKNPRRINPETIMPRIPMTDETMKLITNFLLQQEAQPADVKYLLLTDNPLIWLDTVPDALRAKPRETYFTFCAACHGADGRGNGFNAPFLTPTPTVHADAKYMSRRPDDSLYDAISSGGYIMNRSRFMPPWGGSLAPDEIKGLVGYLRTLCRCQGPAWSLDHAKTP